MQEVARPVTGNRPLISISMNRMNTEWEKLQTNGGIPYYVNHHLEKSQWDHPEMATLMEKLNSYNTIKYAAYRMGAKLLHIQKTLMFHSVHLSVLNSVFETHILESPAHNHIDLECAHLEALLHDIYQKASASPHYKVPQLVNLLLNFLQNLYDSKRKGTVGVLETKVALAVLCTGRVLEKFKYFSQQIANQPNHLISAKSLEKFLETMSRIPELLGEKPSFGSHFVPAAVKSCQRLLNSNIPHLTDEVFFNWLLKEPQNLVWISTFYRMKSSEHVSHPIKCCYCKSNPIAGLRYQCMQCLNYDLCQECFLHGKASKNHSPKHRMQEYCQMTTSWDKVRCVLKSLRYKLQRCKDPRPTYLPLNAQLPAPAQSPPHSPRKARAYETNNNPSSSVQEKFQGFDTLHQQELENIIEKLERENRYLADEIDGHTRNGQHSAVEREQLRKYLHQVESQLSRLKALLQDLGKNDQPNATSEMANNVPARNFLESTPAAGQASSTNFNRFVQIHTSLRELENENRAKIAEAKGRVPLEAAVETPISPSLRRPPATSPAGSEYTFDDLTQVSMSPSVRRFRLPESERSPVLHHQMDTELEVILKQLEELLQPNPSSNPVDKTRVMETVNHVQQVMDRIK